MITIVQQAHGDIHGAHLQLLGFLFQSDEKLVRHPLLGMGDFEARRLQSFQQVIGVERGNIRHTAHTVATQHTHINAGPEQNTRVSGEC